MRFRNQNMYENHPITQVMNKPLLRKKGKRWIVLSLSALALGGLGLSGLTRTNASTMTEPQIKANIQAQDKAHHRKASPKDIDKQAKSLFKRMVENKNKFQRKAGTKKVLVKVPKNQKNKRRASHKAVKHTILSNATSDAGNLSDAPQATTKTNNQNSQKASDTKNVKPVSDQKVSQNSKQTNSDSKQATTKNLLSQQQSDKASSDATKQPSDVKKASSASNQSINNKKASVKKVSIANPTNKTNNSKTDLKNEANNSKASQQKQNTAKNQKKASLKNQKNNFLPKRNNKKQAQKKVARNNKRVTNKKSVRNNKKNTRKNIKRNVKRTKNIRKNMRRTRKHVSHKRVRNSRKHVIKHNTKRSLKHNNKRHAKRTQKSSNIAKRRTNNKIRKDQQLIRKDKRLIKRTRNKKTKRNYRRAITRLNNNIKQLRRDEKRINTKAPRNIKRTNKKTRKLNLGKYSLKLSNPSNKKFRGFGSSRKMLLGTKRKNRKLLGNASSLSDISPLQVTFSDNGNIVGGWMATPYMQDAGESYKKWATNNVTYKDSSNKNIQVPSGYKANVDGVTYSDNTPIPRDVLEAYYTPQINNSGQRIYTINVEPAVQSDSIQYETSDGTIINPVITMHPMGTDGTYENGPVPNTYITNNIPSGYTLNDNSNTMINNGVSSLGGNSNINFDGGTHIVYVSKKPTDTTDTSNNDTADITYQTSDGKNVGHAKISGPDETSAKDQIDANCPSDYSIRPGTNSDQWNFWNSNGTHHASDTIYVTKNNTPQSDTNYVQFNGDSDANYPVTGSDGQQETVFPPQGYQFSDGMPFESFNISNSNLHHSYNVVQQKSNQDTDTINYVNGPISDQSTTMTGSDGTPGTATAPNGYHFTNASDGSFTYDNGTHDMPVAKNPTNNTTTVNFVDQNGDTVGTQTSNNLSDQTMDVSNDVPSGYTANAGQNLSSIPQDGGTHTINVTQDKVTNNVQFNGDSNANYTTWSDYPGATETVIAPQGYTFSDGTTTKSFLMGQNGATQTFNVKQSKVTNYVDYNGDSGANYSISDVPNTNEIVSPPNGYHFTDGNQTESFNIDPNNTTHTYNVAQNNVSDTVNLVNSDNQTVATEKPSGQPNSSLDVSGWVNQNMPTGYETTPSDNTNLTYDGSTHTIKIQRKNVTEHVHFNGANVSDVTKSGKYGSDANTPAPNGYHYVNGSNSDVTLNNDGATVTKSIAGNDASYKLNLTLNYRQGGKNVATKNVQVPVKSIVGQNATYVVNPFAYTNTNSSDAGYTPTKSDMGIITSYLLTANDQNGNNHSQNITLNYDKGTVKATHVPNAVILPFNPGINSPKVPKDLTPNVANDTINFVNKSGKIVGTTKVTGKRNTSINIKGLTPPNNYNIAPNQSAMYNGGTHKILVDDIAQRPSNVTPTKKASPLIIHNDAELDGLKVGQSGLYNGHTVTKLSPNFLHWRYLWALQPYLVHSSFNSVSNPNQDRVARITPQMKRTYHIINIYAEKFGHITVLRYEIDYNGNGGKGYYVTGNKAYTDNAYYDQKGNYTGKTATIQKPVYEYKNINHTYVKTLHPGDTVTIKGIKNISEHPYNLMTRFQLDDGNWVTANKNCIQFD